MISLRPHIALILGLLLAAIVVAFFVQFVILTR